MANCAEHWNNIYHSTEDKRLGWYEQDNAHTLSFLKPVALNCQSTVFIAGAGTSTLAETLRQYGCQLILNDISNEALEKLRANIGDDNIDYVVANISQPINQALNVDLWIDRAVLHFLLSDEDIAGYFANVKQTIKPGGYIMLAEFSKTGAKKCAGLPLRQYCIDDMKLQLGPEFTLIDQKAHLFINPFGDEKPYIYGLFKRL